MQLVERGGILSNKMVLIILIDIAFLIVKEIAFLMYENPQNFFHNPIYCHLYVSTKMVICCDVQ